MKLTELQTTKFTHNVHLPFAVSTSEDDQIISMATDKGVYIIELSSSPRIKSGTLNIHRSFIGVSTFRPTKDCGVDLSFLLTSLTISGVYELVQDASLSPEGPVAESQLIAVKQHAWLSVPKPYSFKPVLAVLTNTGAIQLFRDAAQQWTIAADVSQIWLNHVRSSWESVEGSNAEEMLQTLKKRAHRVKITAFTSCMVNSCCFLFTGTMDGTVVSWRLAYRADLRKIDVELMSVLESFEDTHITSMNALTIDSSRTFLFWASLTGRVYHASVQVDDVSAKFNPSTGASIVWKDTDRIQVVAGGGILTKSFANCTGLFVAKNGYLAYMTIDDNGQSVYCELFHANDLMISGMDFFDEENLLVTTISGKIFSLNFALQNGHLVLREAQEISPPVKNDYNCLGMSFFPSKNLLCIMYSAKTMMDLKEKNFSLSSWCKVTHPKIPENSLPDSSTMRQLSDFFEILRIEFLKNTRPLALYEMDSWDCVGVINLKKNLWIAQLLSLVEQSAQNKLFLEESKQQLMLLIKSHHVSQRAANLISSVPTTEISKLRLHLTKLWLSYVLSALKPIYQSTLTTAEVLLTEVTELSGEGFQEKCGVCGDNVNPMRGNEVTSVCPRGHYLPRCCFTFVQVDEMPYFTCRNCDVIAHPKAVMEEGYSECLFCDSFMQLNTILD